MSGTWPGFSADWEESSEYQERKASLRRERQAREPLSWYARGRLAGFGPETLNALRRVDESEAREALKLRALAIVQRTEGEGNMEASGYGFEDADSVEDVLSLMLDAQPDDVDHMIRWAADRIRWLGDSRVTFP